jgi:hypothetical protein
MRPMGGIPTGSARSPLRTETLEMRACIDAGYWSSTILP